MRPSAGKLWIRATATTNWNLNVPRANAWMYRDEEVVTVPMSTYGKTYSNTAQRWKFVLKSSNARTASNEVNKQLEEELVKHLQMYPNPAQGQLQIIDTDQ